MHKQSEKIAKSDRSTVDAGDDTEHLNLKRSRAVRRRIHSGWDKFERSLGSVLPFSPSLWSWAKLCLTSPLIAYGVWESTGGQYESASPPEQIMTPKLVFWVFFLSLIFDVLRRARLTSLKTEPHQSIDESSALEKTIINPNEQSLVNRFCDLPLNIFLTYSLLLFTPKNLHLSATFMYLLWSRVALDAMSSLMMYLGRGPRKTRLRTMTSELSTYALIALCLGLNPKLINIDNTTLLVSFQVTFSALVLAYQLRLLQKRFIADTLSGLNFVCGLVSIYYSLELQFGTSLLFLLLGGAFDGFDGAAARKFGGTKFGVYSDDIADGMNYGIAPAFAVYALMGGIEGLIIGAFYATFTICRLVYFTLNKDQGDPNYFAGIPSPVGGMIVMSSVVLFTDKPLWVSFLVGVSSTLMVSFKTPYVHIFRGLSWRTEGRKRRALIGAPLFLATFVILTMFWGIKGAASVILSGACAYGFIPSFLSFYFAIFPPKSIDLDERET